MSRCVMRNIRRPSNRRHVVSALCPYSAQAVRTVTSTGSFYTLRTCMAAFSSTAASTEGTSAEHSSNAAQTTLPQQTVTANQSVAAEAVVVDKGELSSTEKPLAQAKSSTVDAESGAVSSSANANPHASVSLGQYFRAVKLQPWQRITVPDGNDRDELPSTILIHGNRIGPRPLFVLGCSRISTTRLHYPHRVLSTRHEDSSLDQTQKSDEMEAWLQVQQRASVFEPMLSQLAWKHGAVYVDLPVHLHVPDMLAWSCRQVCALMTALDVHWTHFLTHGYGTLVAARMACGAVQPSYCTYNNNNRRNSTDAGGKSSSVSHNMNDHRNSNDSCTTSSSDPCVVGSLAWERQNMATTIHRIGTFVSLDTPLITQSMVDNAQRRAELHKAAIDVNVPRAELLFAQQQLREDIARGAGDALPAVHDDCVNKQCVTTGTNSMQDARTAKDENATNGKSITTSNDSGNTCNKDDKGCNKRSSNNGDDARLYNEYLFHPAYMYGTSNGLQCNDTRYIPVRQLAGMHHPFQIITPSQQSLCDAAAHKSFFRSRKLATIKSAKSHADLFRSSDAAVAREVVGVLSAWLSRFEPDDIIARKYAQAVKDMAQLMSGSSGGKQGAATGKDAGGAAVARQPRKEKKNKK